MTSLSANHGTTWIRQQQKCINIEPTDKKDIFVVLCFTNFIVALLHLLLRHPCPLITTLLEYIENTLFSQTIIHWIWRRGKTCFRLLYVSAEVSTFKTITANINAVLCITEKKVTFGTIITILTSAEERFALRRGILRNPIL